MLSHQTNIKQLHPRLGQNSGENPSTGSSFENYEITHRDYDQTRLPIGAEEILSSLQLLANSDGVLLDAGCGTGLYLEVLAQATTLKLVGVDASAAGLEKCRTRLAPYIAEGSGTPSGERSASNILDRSFEGEACQPTNRLTLTCADLKTLPLNCNTFDAVLLMFVLHHLDSLEDQARGEYPQAKETLLKLSEALPPGGKLLLGTCSYEQLDPCHGAMWYYRYFPEAATALIRRFPPIPWLVSTLEGTGLTVSGVHPFSKVIYTDQSFDPYGPFRSDWRSGDSLFAFYRSDADLLAHRLTQLSTAIESGEVQRHMDRCRELTELRKQGVLIEASREC